MLSAGQNSGLHGCAMCLLAGSMVQISSALRMAGLGAGSRQYFFDMVDFGVQACSSASTESLWLPSHSCGVGIWS
jgi:hypothetical protein